MHNHIWRYLKTINIFSLSPFLLFVRDITIIWPCSSPLNGYTTLSSQRENYISLGSSYHKKDVEDHTMMWTGHLCPFGEVLVIFNSLLEKWGQLSRSSHFIWNAEFAVLNLLNSCCHPDYQIFHFFKFYYLVSNFVWETGGSTYWVPLAA